MFSIAYRRGDFEVTLSAYTIEGVLALDDAYNAEEVDDGWITWNGGERPIPDVPVTIILRNGKELFGTASRFVWYHSGYSSDIVAYKVVKNV